MRIVVDVAELEQMARQYERSTTELAGVTIDLRQRLGGDLLERVRAYGLPTRAVGYECERICAALTAHVSELERLTMELERVWAEASGLAKDGRLAAGAAAPDLWWFRVAGAPAAPEPGSLAFAAAAAAAGPAAVPAADLMATPITGAVLTGAGSRPSDFMHATPGTWEEIDRYLLSLGIDINTPPEDWQTTGGRHSPTSYHYRSRARDYCVDEATEILTEQGWRSYLELDVGQFALTLDCQRMVSEWQPVEAVHVFPAQQRVMLRLEGNIHSSLTTPGHRWPVETLRARTVSVTRAASTGENARSRTQCPRGHPYDRDNTFITAEGHRRCRACGRERMRNTHQEQWTERRIITSAELGFPDRIPIAVPCASLPTEPKYSDALVELVGWAWTEGSVAPTGSMGLGRSHVVNPGHVDRIRTALYELYGPPAATPMSSHPRAPEWRETVVARSPRPFTVFRLNRLAAAPITQHLELPEKVPRPEFFRTLTRAQLHLFIDRSMDADGHGQQLAQASRARASAFQMALTLAGVGSHMTQDHSGRWMVSLLRTTRIAPIEASRLKQKDGTARRFVAQWVEHDGPVWCPQTPNGTWLARRAGTVYFTGNSYGMGCNETAIATALRPFLGAGIVELFHAPTNTWYPSNVGAHEDHIHAAIAENFRFPT